MSQVRHLECDSARLRHPRQLAFGSGMCREGRTGAVVSHVVEREGWSFLLDRRLRSKRIGGADGRGWMGRSDRSGSNTTLKSWYQANNGPVRVTCNWYKCV